MCGRDGSGVPAGITGGHFLSLAQARDPITVEMQAAYTSEFNYPALPLATVHLRLEEGKGDKRLILLSPLHFLKKKCH